MRRPLLVALAAALCVVGGVGPAVAAPGPGGSDASPAAETPLLPGSPSSPGPSTSTDPTAMAVPADHATRNVDVVKDGKRSVGLGTVRVDVPADWPVIDLDATPRACVRLDVRAVYVGTPAADQDCPARAIGRADTIVISPTPERLGRSAERSSSAASGRVRVDETGEGRRHVVLPGAGVTVSATWGQDGTARVDDLLAAVSTDADTAPEQEEETTGSVAQEPDPSPGPRSDASPAAAYSVLPAAFTAAPANVAPSGRHLLGSAFDACQAPSVATMQAWRASPYAAVGIYTSGAMRACAQPQLTASWIQQVQAQGWGFMPIHVGLQAPCTESPKVGRFSYDAGTARGQGASEAATAAAALRTLGLPGGSTAYLDIEGYSMFDAPCTNATLAFVSGWTEELRRQGFASGVYGGLGSLMRDMSNAVSAGNASFLPPDHVWFARWNHLQTVRDVNTPTYLPDWFWANSQRLHQYYGDHDETWGGITINIDSNWVDAVLPGNATPTDYGANTVGPGSADFVFTGSMASWRPEPGWGARLKAFSTGASSSNTEFNGATWTPRLDRGIYRAEAYVPVHHDATKAKYTLTDAQGTTSTVVDQASINGWRPLGSVLALPGQPVTVHLGDNGGGDPARRVWVDAVRFVQTGFVPGAPGNVGATASDGRAEVTWVAAGANGAAISSYTITAQPGGRTMTVPGSATSAQFTGLSNGTSHTFTVRATNIVGVGPESAPSVAVTPGRAGGVQSVTPMRLADTRTGTAANPTAKTVIPAGGSVTLRVAGPGTPIPSAATSVVANVTVVPGASPGVLGVRGVESSLVNWAASTTMANEATLPVGSDGTVTLVNRSSTSTHLVVDVQGFTSDDVSTKLATIPSVRLLDSRAATTLNPRATSLGAWETVEVKVVGSGVPAGARAAVLRVTATEGGSGGHFLVSPTGASMSSVVNFATGETVGNVMVAELSAAGTVRLTNASGARTHVVIDAQGWIGVDAPRFWASTPQARVLDTRSGTQANPGVAVLAPGEIRTVKVAGVAGSPLPAGARTMAVNVTVTEGTGPGWIAVGAGAAPSIPMVNYSPREARAGFGWVDVAADGTVRVRNNSYGTVHLVLDVHGHDAAVR